MTSAATSRSPSASEAGFSLPEVLIAMGLMLVVLSGVFTAMTNAIEAQRAVKQVTTMNSNLRVSMDLMVRDLLQVGQGLPAGKRVSVPNGVGATRIIYPGPGPGIPADGPCPGIAQFADLPSLPAVTVGPGVGPRVNGVCTDVVTTLAVDSAFSQEGVAAITANGLTVTIDNDVDIAGGADGIANDLRVGDLLLLTKNNRSALMQVSALPGGNAVTFAAGGPLNLNQFDNTLVMNGTIDQLRADMPVDPLVTAPDAGPDGVVGTADDPGGWGTGQTTASRVWMVTYYVNTQLDAANPRLMRILNNQPPTAVAMGLEALTFTYDLADGVLNPAGVRMDAADVAGVGACDDPDTGAVEVCSENQIRKINLVLAMRSDDRSRRTNQFLHNTLFTQVSLRSMAFVDRYR
jgi:prepilin-type N-terminal cleavage/methylation domain-containing protein